MFLIKFNDQSVLSFNKMEDDFLRFLPDQLELPKEDITACYIPQELQIWMSQPNQFVDFSTGLAQKFTIENDERVDVDGAIPLDEVVIWPYDKDGKFLGNRMKMPSLNP